MNPKENEGQVRFLLDTYPCLRLVDASVSQATGANLRIGDYGLPNDFEPPPPPFSTSPVGGGDGDGDGTAGAVAASDAGVTAKSVFGERGGLSEEERVLVQRFHSQTSQTEGHGSGSSSNEEDQDTPGFFVAKFVKVESSLGLLLNT